MGHVDRLLRLNVLVVGRRSTGKTTLIEAQLQAISELTVESQRAGTSVSFWNERAGRRLAVGFEELTYGASTNIIDDTEVALWRIWCRLAQQLNRNASQAPVQLHVAILLLPDGGCSVADFCMWAALAQFMIVIPVISRADSKSDEEVAQFIARLTRQLDGPKPNLAKIKAAMLPAVTADADGAVPLRTMVVMDNTGGGLYVSAPLAAFSNYRFAAAGQQPGATGMIMNDDFQQLVRTLTWEQSSAQYIVRFAADRYAEFERWHRNIGDVLPQQWLQQALMHAVEGDVTLQRVAVLPLAESALARDTVSLRALEGQVLQQEAGVRQSLHWLRAFPAVAPSAVATASAMLGQRRMRQQEGEDWAGVLRRPWLIVAFTLGPACLASWIQQGMLR